MALENPQQLIQDITSGYAFTGPALELGVALAEGHAYPEARVRLPLRMMNRHGLVAGATGTGKTVTLQAMAEQLSAQGVPVFLADIKGDLSGLASPGTLGDKLVPRLQASGQQWSPQEFPVEFLALGGQGMGVPVRATVSDFGPILLARVMGLNETQESSLQLVFHFADRNDLELVDTKDLRAVIQHLMSDEGKAQLEALGGVSKQTAGVILRKLLTLEVGGMSAFFGEPEFNAEELLRAAPDGRGVITCLELVQQQMNPQLFSTFLMWLVADLFQTLPEVGDQEKPKLVFFLDEAHLLFKDATPAFLSAITNTVRLIRSKGVGLFFVTQTPKDIPADILAQLANRVQHALRTYTPDDAKALKATVSTFPHSPYDLEEALTSAGIGEAVVTVMGETGAPTPVAWTLVRSPESNIGPSDPEKMATAVAQSALLPAYATAVDPVSAYEKLNGLTPETEATPTGPAVGQADPRGGAPVAGQPPAWGGVPTAADIDAEARRIEQAILGGSGSISGPMATSGPPPAAPEAYRPPVPQVTRRTPARTTRTTPPAAPPAVSGGVGAALGGILSNPQVKRVATQVATQVGREIVRGIFGNKRRRRW